MNHNNNGLKRDTLAVHAGVNKDPLANAVMPPVYLTTTYIQEQPGEYKGWDYSRAGNPTRDSMEQALAHLESAKHGLAFSSGLAAEQVVLQALLKPGDHVVVCDDVYGGSGRLFRKVFQPYGLEFDFVDMSDLQNIKKAIKSSTKLFWVETPTNPMLKIIDIQAVADLAHQTNALILVDNTFASPIFQSPLELGADIVLHSTTKYIGGHSDIVGGALMLNQDELFEKLKFIQFAAGSIPSPFDSYLLHRSIKTLPLRMKKHAENAKIIASFLEEHKAIKSVFYPGLASHPGHDIAKKQMRDFSGMVSFVHQSNDYQAIVKFFNSLKVFELAESLGGVESLANHPEKMTHASVPAALREKLGITSQLVRLSVGIEDAEDLCADLDQALNRSLNGE